jgi:hypothetical protein
LQLFETVFRQLSPELRQAIDRLLMVSDGEQRSYFYHLKEYPPAPSISSIQSYLQRYQTVAETGIDEFENQALTPEFLDYLFKQAKRYSAKDLKRFADHKRYTLMICFLLETRKTLLDHLVTMHDQYVIDISRQTKNAHEKKHRELRKRQKRAIDVMLDTTVDMLRHVLHDFVREETLTAASAEIVNRHHELPLSAVHGTGTLSSSDAQRFGIRGHRKCDNRRHEQETVFAPEMAEPAHRASARVPASSPASVIGYIAPSKIPAIIATEWL